ncbi:MAG TPA: class I SAM-dependent methyltransferase [Chitinophagaceae bacterium]|nr:class I SAM-dependent methyltransferase [Chitinophagaceae bacterium]
MQNTPKVLLMQERETLLITLYAKALDNRSRKPVLHDEKADEILESIEYDFTKFNSFGKNNIIVVRARQYDEWVKTFLQTHTAAVVINMGCGLDTRVTRINPGPLVSWYDVDYPEVIALRKNFYEDSSNYTMIESSVTAPGWFANIPRSRNVIIVAEGVFEYLTEADVKTLLTNLTNHFAHGEIMFDVMSSFAIKGGREKLKETTGAEHKWAVDDPATVDALNPVLQRMDALPLLSSKYMQRLPFFFWLLYGVMGLFSRFKYMIRLMRYKF